MPCALSRCAWLPAEQNAHRLKGTAGNLNFDGFMICCSILQANFEHGAVTAAEGKSSRLTSEWSTEVKDLVGVVLRRAQLIKDRRVLPRQRPRPLPPADCVSPGRSLKKWQSDRPQRPTP